MTPPAPYSPSFLLAPGAEIKNETILRTEAWQYGGQNGKKEPGLSPHLDWLHPVFFFF